MIFTFLLTTQSFWNKSILISGSSIKTRTIQNHQKSQDQKVYFCRHSHFETHEVLTVCMTEILLMAVCQGNVNDNNISSLLLTSQNLAFSLISSWIWQFLKISNHNQSHSCYSCFGMSKVVPDSKCVKLENFDHSLNWEYSTDLICSLDSSAASADCNLWNCSALFSLTIRDNFPPKIGQGQARKHWS